VTRFGKLYLASTRHRSRSRISKAIKFIDMQCLPTGRTKLTNLSDRTSTTTTTTTTTSKLCSPDVLPKHGRPRNGSPNLRRHRRHPATRVGGGASSAKMMMIGRGASGDLHDNGTTRGARPRVKHKSALVNAHVNVFMNLVDQNMVDKQSSFEHRLVDIDDRMMSSSSSPDRCQRFRDRSPIRHQRRRVYVVRLGFVAWSKNPRKIKPPAVNTETKVGLATIMFLLEDGI